MEGHQRNLYLYERFNTQVVGVSRDDVTTLRYWTKDLGITFPLLSNVSAWLGILYDAQPGDQPVFNRRTVIIDKEGVIRYVKDGSPDYKDILAFLKNRTRYASAAPTVASGQKGAVIYNGEYEFRAPPAPWELIKGNESTNYIFGYYRKDPGNIRLESTFLAYDEEPYGYSRKLEERADQFLKRFFWSSHVKVTVLERKKATVLGGEGLALLLEGKDPVKRHKVRSRVLFGKRGERVVAMYVNQWRTFDHPYDESAFDVFDRFAGSFRFLKKSFYEEL